jgi:hypothetical protein
MIETTKVNHTYMNLRSEYTRSNTVTIYYVTSQWLPVVWYCVLIKDRAKYIILKVSLD